MTTEPSLNADFSQRVVIQPDDYRWQASPVPGVNRVRLDLVSETVERATTLVQFAPNTGFTPHAHPGGEEFLVLDGAFGDEHGLYGAGSYVRNPPGSAHTPAIGPTGAFILVKLHQFDPADSHYVRIQPEDSVDAETTESGLHISQLHQFGAETTALIRWDANCTFDTRVHHGGEEMFVVAGSLFDEHGHYPAGTWIRSPDQSKHTPYTTDSNALTWVKSGHLRP